MSADLFAEFNDLAKSPPPASSQAPNAQASQPQAGTSNDPFDFFQSANKQSFTPSQANTQWSAFQAQPSGFGAWDSGNAGQAAKPSNSAQIDDDEGWGDFETATPQPPAPFNPQAPQQWQNPASAPAPVAQAPPRAGIVRASTMELMTNSLVDLDVSPAPHVKQSAQSRLRQAQNDPNVLFDAGDFELEGGEFEGEEDDDDDDDDFGDFETVAPKPSGTNAPTRPKPQPSAP
jgi:hypothetical protein